MKTAYFISAVIGFILLASYTHADGTDYAVVAGRIYNINDYSEGIAGANVTITCNFNGSSISTSSGTDGHYSGGLYCPIDTTVTVYAAKSGMSGNDTGTITYLTTFPGTVINLGVAQVDVAIPEYPSAILPAILSLASFGLVRQKLRGI